ncbi:Gldg family protein [Pseudobacter ginsenosidimutans]|uniref:ABC-2 type transport system permease protein n=1 Tax=Pseudobacter ginsenosidimutans TaxID=661488 RepID=A0A4Q7N3B3_9BACT|nr:Gldg family protein [Pseudobacter ginsenosidimutans]QEC43462.1 ABC transporter permease subunit [Pseudobacter ginsenosidimutans]RZS74848.1 ABC-2 type transport system permease protein [Pseudobacter ginsenosidimutans]
MKTTCYLARTEIQKLFYSPVPWLVLVIYCFQSSLIFTGIWSQLLKNLSLGYDTSAITLRNFSDEMRGGAFQKISNYLYLYIPLITMGIMSRDISSGSIKQLYSSPITNWQIIMGKYLALLVFCLAITAVTGIFCLYAFYSIENVEVGLVLTGLLGMFLLMCAYCAIGLFMSSLTSYSVVAAMLTLGILFILNNVGTVGLDYAIVRDITYWLSLGAKSTYFIFGLISSKNLLYFLLVSGMFLGFTYIKLSSARQSATKMGNFLKYLAVFLGASLTGVISSLPSMQFYLDTTRSKINTLSKASQEVLSSLDEQLTVYTYSNMLDKGSNAHLALPKYVNYDFDRFANYVRFKPDTKIEYEYYYHKTDNEHLEKQYPFLTDEERLEKLKEINDWNFKIIPFASLQHKADLSSENYRFVRMLETRSGKRSFLRVFDDNWVLPFESEITAAIKGLVTTLPTIGFVSGHGERDSRNEFDRGYNRIAEEKAFRYSFINQGFYFADVSLGNAVPDSISILIIAEPRSPLSDTDRKHLDEYIARGGNLLICGEPDQVEWLNPLTGSLGVEFLKGTLVKPGDKSDPTLSILRPTAASKQFSFHMEEMLKSKNDVLVFPAAGALKVSRDHGFSVIPLVTSDSTEGWLELQTTNFVDDAPSFDPATEIKQPYETVVALSRKVNNKEQRIIIAGDADWISNGEILKQRPKIRTANYYLIKAVFYWLSEGKAPIDTRRAPPTDNSLTITKAGWAWHSFLLKWVLPLAIVAFTAVFLLRRKRK